MLVATEHQGELLLLIRCGVLSNSIVPGGSISLPFQQVPLLLSCCHSGAFQACSNSGPKFLSTGLHPYVAHTYFK